MPDQPPPVEAYVPGTWGPPTAGELIAPRRWHLPAHVARGETS